ncbi:MAG: hypothetical protein FWE45_00975 [Firmicutes bacterium]|nr:hypothetical protein [Bacillota bacterium]
MYTDKEVEEQGIDDIDWYAVHNEIWKKYCPEQPDDYISTPESKGYFLCIKCLETRMGRKLKRDDFPDYPINKKNLHRYPE